jgi:hypothetical protein
MLAQPATPAEAVPAVDEDIAHGADMIKLFMVSWVGRGGKHVPVPMSLAIVEAATSKAHRHGKLVFAHPSTIKGVAATWTCSPTPRKILISGPLPSSGASSQQTFP